MKILIIAGHGNGDPGAGSMGYQEAQETRNMAPRVQRALTAYEGVSASVFNTSLNAYKHLKNGGHIPFADYDLAIELHFNAAVNDTRGDGMTTGVEVLHKGSTNLAAAVSAQISAVGFKNRGAKYRGDLLVMNVASRSTKHILIETCFIDDKDDMQVYALNRDKIADAIAAGVAQVYGLKMEDHEMVIKKTVLIDGKQYACDCIEKDGYNYIQLRALTQAGYDVAFDNVRKIPTLTAPQSRPFVPEPTDEQQDAIDTLQEVCGLEDQSVRYMRRYKYGDELVGRIASHIK